MKDAEGELEEPDEPITGYYLRVKIEQNYGTAENPDWQEAGWNLIPVTLDRADNMVSVEKFVNLQQNPLGNNPPTWTDINPQIHRINLLAEEPVRLLKVPNPGNLNNYNDCFPTESNGITGDAPDGYSHKGLKETTDGVSVNLQKAKPKNYFVRVKVEGATSLGDVPSVERDNEGTLFVKVTLEHKNNPTTYGFVQLKDNMKKVVDGTVMWEVPIEHWVDANNEISVLDDVFTGNEKSINVKLVYYDNSYGLNPKPGQAGYVLQEGQYVNNAKIIDYPDTQKEPERIKRTSVEDPTWEDVIDIVSLKVNTDSYSGYTLEEILTDYNVVTLCPNGAGNPGTGDAYLGCHQMGGVLIRGDAVFASKTTGVADSYAVSKPSVIGGRIGTTSHNNCFINNRTDNIHANNFYTGSINSVYGNYLNGVLHEQAIGGVMHGFAYTGDTVVNDKYVNWNKLQTDVKKQSVAISNTSSRTITASSGDTIDILVGEHVTIDCPDGAKVTINGLL